MQPKRLVISSRVFSVVDSGGHKPILFVHGFPLDHTMWIHQWEAFHADYRVIIPDLAGFGGSAPAKETMTMADYADDLARIYDELGIQEPVIMVGLSMGGYILLEFLQRFKDRVQGVVFCDSRAANDSAEVAKARQILANEVQSEGTQKLVQTMIPKLFSATTQKLAPEKIADTRLAMQRATPSGIAAAARGMAVRRDFRPFLAEFNLPACLICGEDDVITPPAEMQSMADALPQATFHCIPQAGHMAPLEAPAATNEILHEFFRDL